jgi:hypothetical protein
MRSELISAITTAISTLTQFAVSSELPWDQNGTPLYRKNMKRVYVDQEYRVENVMIPVLTFDNIMEDEIKTNVYLAVDAKNTPSQLNSLVTKILSTKDSLGIVNFSTESDYTADKQEDVLIYSFEFRLKQIKQ